MTDITVTDNLISGNDLQFNVLSTKTADNTKMTYKSSATLNKALNPNVFTGASTSIVNAINATYSRAEEAINQSKTAVASSSIGTDEERATLAEKLTATTVAGMLIELYDMVQAKGDGAETPSTPNMEGYAKLSDLEAYAKIVDLPSLDDYAKSADLTGLVTEAQLKEVSDAIPSVSGFVTADVLDAYAKVVDIPSLDGYAKLTDIPSLDGYVKSADIADVVHTSALENYVTKAELAAEVEALSKIGPSFEVVEELPTENISTSAIYIIRNEATEGDNLYTEYYYKNGAWEVLGSYAPKVTDEFQEIIEAHIEEDETDNE